MRTPKIAIGTVITIDKNQFEGGTWVVAKRGKTYTELQPTESNRRGIRFHNEILDMRFAEGSAQVDNTTSNTQVKH